MLHDIKPYQLVAHTGTIHEMLIHKRCLFTASGDGTIKMWDCHTLLENHCMAGHKKAVFCLAAKGDILFSGSADHTIRMWNLANNCKEAKTSLRKHQNHVNSLVIMNDKLFSASADSTILVWNISPLSDTPIGVLRGHRDSIVKLLPIPKQNKLISGCRDSIIKVWDLNTMTEIFSFVNPGVVPSVMAISTSEDVLFTSSWDNTIKVWNLENITEPPFILRGHSSPISAIAVAGDRMYSGGVDGTAKVWSVDTLLVLSSHKGHGQILTALAPDGGTFFSVSTDKSIIRHFSGIEEGILGEA